VPNWSLITRKTYTNVSQCSIVWQNSKESVDYLAILSQHYVKIKNKPQTIDSQKPKLIGVQYTLDVIKLSLKKIQTVTHSFENIDKNNSFCHLSWEPCAGRHLCVLFSNLATIFKIEKQANKMNQVAIIDETLLNENFFYNRAMWMPFGQYLTLVDYKSPNGYLAFIDGHDGKVLEMGLTNNYIHYAEWEPFCRFLLTANLTQLHQANDSSIAHPKSDLKFWSVSGRMFASHDNVGIMCACQIRPRPDSQLNEKKIENIRKEIGQFADEFKEQDRLREQFESLAAKQKLKLRVEQFLNYISQNRPEKKEIFSQEPSIEIRQVLTVSETPITTK
ncbi:MAG: translation initiation factor eIF-3b like protein, partial [Paramarteilia canceri]